MAAEKLNAFKNLHVLILRVGYEEFTFFFASYLNASWSLQLGMAQLPPVA